MADPNLKGNYPEKGLNQAIAVAAMCLQEEASIRPFIADVVTALDFLSMPTDDCSFKNPSPLASPIQEAIGVGELSAAERQQAIAEAIKWGSSSRGSRMASDGGE